VIHQGLAVSAPDQYCAQLTPTQVDDLHAILVEAFSPSPENQRRWVDIFGTQNLRALTIGDEVIGGCGAVPFGHYFGGSRVSAVGIAGVAVAAQHRAGGTATRLLKQVLEEQRAAGMALSSLYPATVKLYRRLGYELAGYSTVLRVPLHTIDCRERSLELQPIRPGFDERVVELYQRYAHQQPGQLDRVDFNWHRKFKTNDDKPRDGFLVMESGSPTGYVLYEHKHSGGYEPSHFQVFDWVAHTPNAARRILSFCADHRTTRRDLIIAAAPHDPAFALLGEFPWKTDINEFWMLRILNMKSAFEERGYPSGISAELHFRVCDDVIPENTGDWTLCVADGVGKMSPGGRGEIEIDIRSLASIYAAFHTPDELRRIDAIQGSPESLALLSTVFAGPKAWLRDWF
jgi:predicted acetyltransferase